VAPETGVTAIDEVLASHILREVAENHLYRSQRDCEQVALRNRLPTYHGKINPDERQQNYATWLRTGGLISATTALGLAIDEPRIDLVVCFGAQDMIMMCQQFGRAGRSGRWGTCVLASRTTTDRTTSWSEPSFNNTQTMIRGWRISCI
jgi:superfamily II DNA helicase RecQ